MLKAVNVGSGQRKFDVHSGWINLDCISREGQIPDVLGDGTALPVKEGSLDYVVLHHCLEHFPVEAGEQVVKEAWKALRLGGSLLVFVPNLEELAKAVLVRRIPPDNYKMHLFGAYMGAEGDRHKWGWFNFVDLRAYLWRIAKWSEVKQFDGRRLPGADIAGSAFWILEAEAVK